MKFLAIDTSGKYLSVVAYNEGRAEKILENDCAMKHSVVLMDKIAEAFFAAVTGPGSFTGIRIGISTVKGLCFALQKPALSVTSFDCIAYNEESEKRLALIDAGRGELYACGYAGSGIVSGPAIVSLAQAEELVRGGFVPLSAEEIPFGAERADPCEGLVRAVLKKAGEAAPASGLRAFYMRRSSAEENRK